ncbi:MAG: N-acetylmuramoyl-L-alanine amidase, partial [Planctomycetota bacterium]
GDETARHGDEIVVAGRFFRTGTRVVTWLDPQGYNAYRVEARFADLDQSSWDALEDTLPAWGSPNRYGMRIDRFNNGRPDFTPEEIEAVRGGTWQLEQLQDIVDQFVIHYDACGTSKYCFEVLQDMRSLSVHFLLDVDGTIYQTLDLQERAWHATTSNSRSVGIEIANVGAYAPGDRGVLDRWYTESEGKPTVINIPADRLGNLNPETEYSPSCHEPVLGVIHGQELVQYDLTHAQYDALIKLTATLNKVLPKIKLNAPRDDHGNVRMDVLSPDEQAAFQGVIAHHHITVEKVDPGPAFDWERLFEGAKKLR